MATHAKYDITVTIAVSGGASTLEMLDLVVDEALAFKAFSLP